MSSGKLWLAHLAALATLALMGCSAGGGPEVSARAQALGEPTDGFPSWAERVVHVWTNRARSDPAADLAGCSNCAEAACYSAAPPLEWDHDLARSSRFHSENLVRAGCSLQHPSPCTLVSNIGSIYTPGSCNGSPSCACQGGSASCGSSGTSSGDRIRAFDPGGGGTAENIARGGNDPIATHYQWLHEPDSNSACGFRLSNGHRFNILNPANETIGVGRHSTTTTQNFRRNGSPDGIVAGVHTPQNGPNVEFRANWFRSGGPDSAIVNVDGNCSVMNLERGSAANGTYLASVNVGSGCSRYFFHFTDGAEDVFFPTTGSFGIGCGDDWDAARPGMCGCTPDCSGKQCGDDGCGGSCGTCSGPTACQANQCECTGGRTRCGNQCVNLPSNRLHCGSCNNPCADGERCRQGQCECVPDCDGRSCGSDGCGGDCGSCDGGEVCSGGSCECSGSLIDCGGECVDTRIDEDHCGSCGSSCAPGETCLAGSCGSGSPDGGCTPACDGRDCGDDTCGGSCGACAGNVCAAGGQCLCPDDFSSCGGDCVDVRGDPDHCGACDSPCESAEDCVAGECVPDGSGAGGRPGDGGGAGASGSTASAGSGGSGPADAGPDAGDEGAGDDGGCSCRSVGHGPPGSSWPLWLLLGLAARRRRR